MAILWHFLILIMNHTVCVSNGLTGYLLQESLLCSKSWKFMMHLCSFITAIIDEWEQEMCGTNGKAFLKEKTNFSEWHQSFFFYWFGLTGSKLPNLNLKIKTEENILMQRKKTLRNWAVLCFSWQQIFQTISLHEVIKPNCKESDSHCSHEGRLSCRKRKYISSLRFPTKMTNIWYLD